MSSISAGCSHPAAVSLHCLVRILFLNLTCLELYVLHCHIICLFQLGPAFAGSAFEFAPICHILFHVLSMSSSTCHVLSFWQRKRQCISGNVASCSFLVCQLNHNFSVLRLTNFSIHHRKVISVFQLPQKNQYLTLVISVTCNHLSQALCCLGTHQRMWVGHPQPFSRVDTTVSKNGAYSVELHTKKR